jgi:hypothetical protein
MASERRTPIPPAGQIFDRVRMGGKRTAVAGVLVLILVFMWLRVFLGHRAAGAAAAPPASAATTVAPTSATSVQRIELPRIPGRHDAIQRDFFVMKDRALFRREAAGGGAGTVIEVTVASSQDVPEVIQRVARTMKLEAVLWNESPRIYINDRLLEVGDRCVVKNGAQSFEFEVLQIYVDSVLVECAGVQLTLKLAQRRETVP